MSITVITGTPTNIQNIQVLNVCTTTYTTQLNEKSLLQTIFGNKNDQSFTDGINQLINIARNIGGDIIFDIKVSTATAQFKNGTYLYTTLVATIGKE